MSCDLPKFDLTLLGFTVPDHMIEEVLRKDKNLPLQTHKFAWSLARALRNGGANVHLLSALPISNFPAMPKVLVMATRFSCNGFFGRTLGFINIVGLKHVTRFLACLFSGEIVFFSSRSSVIIVHGVHSPFLWFSVLARLFKRKVVVVLTDPPGVILPSDGRLIRFLKKVDRNLVKSALSHVDGVIALTQALVDDFSPNTPALILCGFMDQHLEELQLPKPEYRETFSVAYAGGLSEQYGVGHLLDAVMGVDSLPISLTLYGKGPLLPRILECASVDARISYGGVVHPRELSSLLQRADLLINPRPSVHDFVRHSFPSKIIEYMALGVPVASTRLPGIPSGYLDEMYVIDDESSAGIRAALERIAMIPLADRVMKAARARNYVVSVASESAQGVRIGGFLRSFLKS